MPNNIDLIFSQNAIKSIDDVIAKLGAADAELINMGKTIADVSKAFANIKAPTALSNLTTQLNDINDAMKNNIATVRTLESTLANYQSQVNAANQANNTNTTSTNANTTSRNRNVQATNQATAANNTLSQSQANQTRQTQGQRNGFNSLSNSINQLTREAPAFANSVSTGFMAISNNIGPLVDGIQDTKRRVAELNAEFARTGQGQAVSIWSEIGKSLFSFNTLISVGITLLTVYGAKLIETAFGLSETEQAMKSFRDTLANTNVLITNQVTSLREHLTIMNDQKQSTEERALAEKNVRDALEDANILEEGRKVNIKELTSMTESYIKTLVKRAKWEAHVAEITKATMEMDKLKESISSPEKIKQTVEREVGVWDKIVASFATKDKLGETKEFDKYIQNRIVNPKVNRIQTLARQIAIMEKKLQEDLEAAPDKEKAKSTGRHEEQKVTEKKIKEQHEFNVQEINERIKTNEIIVSNEQASDADRLASAQKLLDDKNALIEEERSYAQYAYAFDKKVDAEALNDKINSGKMSARELKQAKKELARIESEYAIFVDKNNKDAINKQYQALNEYSKKVGEINKFDEAALKKHFDTLIDIEEVYFKQELKNLEDQKTKQLSIEGLTQKEKKFILEKTNYQILEAQRKHNIQLKELEIARLTGIIQLNEEHVKKFGAGSGLQQSVIDGYLRDIEKLREGIAKHKSEKTEDPDVLRIKGLMEALNELFTSKAFEFLQQQGLGSLISGFFEDIDKDIPGIQTRFEVLAESIKKGGKGMNEQIALIAESMRDVMKVITGLMDDNIEEEKARLEERYNTALKFAGLSEEGKKSIEEEYARQSKIIKEKEWRNKNAQAQQEIIMNTLVGVTQALTQKPPYSFVLAGIVAALGAAQLVQVKSLQMPVFAEGGVHTEGGLALVNDGKGSNYNETIVTPSGKIFQPKGRNVVMDLPKGTEIFTNEQWKQKAIQGMFNGKEVSINQNINNGLTSDELDSVIGKHFAKITTQSVSFDAQGIKQWVSNGNNKTIRTESRGTGIGFKV